MLHPLAAGVLGAVIATVAVSTLLGSPTAAVEEKPQRRAARTPPAPVVSTINLPGEDGRVHKLATSDGYEVTNCFVLISPSGNSVACTPSEIDWRPSER